MPTERTEGTRRVRKTARRGSSRTKAELVAELAALRRRLVRLEKSSEGHGALREHTERQEEILGSIVDHLEDGFVVADEHGKFLLFNEAAERILGLGKTDSPPERWSEVYGIYYPDRVTRFPWEDLPLVRALSGEISRQVEMFVRNPQIPEGVYISVTGSPLERDGRLRGAVAVFRDITERLRAAQADELRALARQQAEQRLRTEAELERLRDELVRQTRLSTIGELAASIAHDLRNPLGAIRNAGFFLGRRVPAGREGWARHLTIIEQEVRTAEGIIDGLLDVGRARSPSKQIVDLGAAIHACVEHLGVEERIELQLLLDPAPFEVHADPAQLQRVLSNLLTNALQAMGGSGGVSIAARRDGEIDEVTVADRGPGVPVALRERVFEPLFTTRAKGTGLGLAICRRIAERHGGTIDYVEREGWGSTFRLRLPRAPARRSQPVAES